MYTSLCCFSFAHSISSFRVASNRRLWWILMCVTSWRERRRESKAPRSFFQLFFFQRQKCIRFNCFFNWFTKLVYSLWTSDPCFNWATSFMFFRFTIYWKAHAWVPICYQLLARISYFPEIIIETLTFRKNESFLDKKKLFY